MSFNSVDIYGGRETNLRYFNNFKSLIMKQRILCMAYIFHNELPNDDMNICCRNCIFMEMKSNVSEAFFILSIIKEKYYNTN